MISVTSAATDSGSTNEVSGDSKPAAEFAEQLAGLFKLCADETRLRIIYLLLHEQEMNVRTLCERLEQSQPAVSHHLALLREAEMIECRRDGKHNFYRLLPGRFEHWVRVIFQSLPDVADVVTFPGAKVRLESST